MKYRRSFLLLTASAVTAALMTGCSLLKFSLDTGDKPMTADQVNTRLMTRGFYYDLRSEVVGTADSIASAAPDATVAARAIRWKIGATGAAVAAAMQSIPDVALLDTWLLCRRMDAAFSALPDSLLFGSLSAPARQTAARLAAKAGQLAENLLPADRYRLMEEFVAEYERENPVGEDAFAPANTTLAWIDFLRLKGIDYSYSTGTISEVVADMSDRVDGQTRHFANSLSWSKDLIELRLEQDSLRDRLTGKIDSLEGDFRRMVTVMESLPEISDSVMVSLNLHMGQLISALDDSVDNVFQNLDSQRSELQRYASQQQERLVEQTRSAADGVVQHLLDALPALVGKVVVWLILLFLVVLGVPFALGFWLGRLRERSLRKKEEPDREGK